MILPAAEVLGAGGFGARSGFGEEPAKAEGDLGRGGGEGN
jgi:hypothetical protein